MPQVKKNKTRDSLLHFLNMKKNPETTKVMNRILKNTTSNIGDVLPKLVVLRREISDLGGIVGLSVQKNYIKISQNQKDRLDLAIRFYDICKDWEKKTGIGLYYNPINNVFYIK